MLPARLAALAAGLALATATPGHAAPAPRRVLLLSLDGAGAHALGRAVAQGRMPRLAALQAAGAMAGQLRPSFPAASAPAHAALFTGAWGPADGALVHEPLYVTAARAGRRVLTLHAPLTTPLAAFAPGGRFGEGTGDRLMILDGHLGLAGPDGAWDEGAGIGAADAWTGLPASAVPPRELAGRVAGQPLYLALIDDPQDPVEGYDTALASWTRDGRAPVARLKPRAPREDAAWSPAVRVPGPANAPAATTFLRLFDLEPAGGRALLYHTAPARVVGNAAAAPVFGAIAPGGFVPGGAAEAYAAGRLGRTLADGGDGRAEERYLATARFKLARDRAALLALADRSDWDLLVAHVPLPDEAEHLWHGYIAPGSPAFDRALAPRLARGREGVYADLDALIGVVRAGLPADVALVIVGDHGMAPVRWDFRPNVALRRAGLLAVGRDGQVDLARTRALVLPGGGGVAVNTTARARGIVPPAEAPGVLAEARKVLGAVTVKTPAGVVPLVRAWTEATPEAAAELGLAPAPGAHAYPDLQPGYDSDPDPTGDALFRSRPANASGAHGFDPRRPELQAACYAVGAGIKRGGRLAQGRLIDVAPTVARLLGMPAPPQATGRVLDELLAP